MFIRNTRRAQALISNGLHCMADNGDEGEKGGDSGDGKTAEQRLAALESRLTETSSELDRYKAKHGEAEKHRKAAEEAAREAAEEAAKKSGNVEALESSWKSKLEQTEKAAREKVANLESAIGKLTTGSTATTIASELAVKGSAKALLPHVQSRLSTEYIDGEPVVRVLDEKGKPSAMTLEDLKEEFRKDSAFAPLLQGSKASGSGGSAQSAAGGGVTIKQSDFDAMAPTARAKFFKENPSAQIVQ